MVTPCVALDWDSEFFGVSIARVSDAHLSEETCEQASRWCKSNQVKCLYFLCDVGDSRSSSVAEANGFRLMDVRVQLVRPSAPLLLNQSAGQCEVRFAERQDEGALEAIARSSHTHSRFFHDSHFLPKKSEALYETWIRKSCRGWADTVGVAMVDGHPAGYVTCHLEKAGGGKIGLLAVAEAAQGQGVGRSLVGWALEWFASRTSGTISVVTQARNKAGLRLYQKCGFSVQEMSLWFHRWFSE